MAKATLVPDVIHLVEPSCRTYCGRFLAACGALVDYRDEGRRLAQKLAVNCPACLARVDQDDAAIESLQETTR